MKLKFANSYQAALQVYLQQRTPVNLRRASGMGQQALAAGLQTLDIAKLHEQVLVNKILLGRTPDQRVQLIKQAGAFFAEAITPIEKTHPSARDAAIHLSQIVEALSQRTVELAASNLELTLEITHRKAVEVALKKSEHHYSKLLERSENLQEQLRQLSRQILSAQEEERREISRESCTMSSPRRSRASMSGWRRWPRKPLSTPRRSTATSPKRRSSWKNPWTSSTGSRANCARRCWTISA